MDKFEKWFNKVNEELAVSPTINTEVADVAVTDVDADRSNMIGDIDTIMTSLETLASELTEELAIELEDLNEAGKSITDKAGDFIKSWITGMKATKAQGKVNKIKMNASDLRFAADNAKDSNSTNLDKKATAAKEQAKDLQTLVDKKFSAAGSYVTNKLQAAKIAGQIEIIKRTTGMEDDPKKKAALKDKMVELAVKYKEEVAATKELEDDNKEEIAANKKKTKGDTPGDDKQGTPVDKDNRTDAQKQADAAKEEETRKATLKNADGADDATKADREKKNSKDGLMDRYKVLLKKAQDNGDETKAKDIQSKIDAISQRESWQLDGTELGRIFEMELIRYENSFALNESRHNVDSIKDKFNTLLNS